MWFLFFSLLLLQYVCVCANVFYSSSSSSSLECRKKNRTNDANRMFKRCTEIDATYVQAHLELFRLHRGSQAALILSDAIKANSENIELRLVFGHWLLNNGNDHLANIMSIRICRCVYLSWCACVLSVQNVQCYVMHCCRTWHCWSLNI